ncbi:acyloxyacyl hydrolase [Aquisalimonas lutea]|uniref:acyloxyacyl hydrolase n=1 Tax=Aquisalimonas lutea TaxID=1327750 RepID=UPI0025B5D06E|nr:acyloxyacyl hydrolase [Aquisalimonas lutea]MDN3517283.1 acyloxyacyl hydrolase [Aquisalimonas lutea]
MAKYNNHPSRQALRIITRLRHGRVHAIVAGTLALCIAAGTTAHAGEIGVRGGIGLREYSLDAGGIFWRPEFVPFTAEPGGAWRLTGYTELHASHVRRRGESMNTAGVTLGGWFTHPQSPVRFGVGTGPTYISEKHLPDHAFGIHFQFTSHVTVRLDLSRWLSIGYRIEHTSNAGLHSDNKGYDLQMIELRAGF